MAYYAHYLLMVELSVVNNVGYRRLPRYGLEQLTQSLVTTAYDQHFEQTLPKEDLLTETPVGVQQKQEYTTQARTLSGTLNGVYGTIRSTRIVERYWRRITYFCAKVLGRTWNCGSFIKSSTHLVKASCRELKYAEMKVGVFFRMNMR